MTQKHSMQWKCSKLENWSRMSFQPGTQLRWKLVVFIQSVPFRVYINYKRQIQRKWDTKWKVRAAEIEDLWGNSALRNKQKRVTYYRGGTVVKVLRYKSEGRWFDSRWFHWNFSLTRSFRSRYDPGVDSASKRNEYQNFLGVNAAGA